MTKEYYVYIIASDRNGTLYIGVTNDLIRRIEEHKTKKVKGFTSKYNIMKLVYYESFVDVKTALAEEKRIKAWKRAWKISLIEENNPHWKDLSLDF